MVGQVEFNARLERAAMHCRCSVLDDILLLYSRDCLLRDEKRPRDTLSTYVAIVRSLPRLRRFSDCRDGGQSVPQTALHVLG